MFVLSVHLLACPHTITTKTLTMDYSFEPPKQKPPNIYVTGTITAQETSQPLVQ